MRICLDIGHPAHVHYFKNFIKIMESRGHCFLVFARDREQVFHLLQSYGIPYRSRGPGMTGKVGKLVYLVKADWQLWHLARAFKPDLFLSFASTYAAHAARLLGRPHIAFDDTEHSTLEHLLYAPFTSLICTPACFRKDFGKKHRRFEGFMELCHLHPNYFRPDPSIRAQLGLEPDEPFVIMRLISWQAGHDSGHSGLSPKLKRQAVQELSHHARVFISSEAPLPEDLQAYQLCVPPERIHDVLYEAELFFGESGTMATEAALLGTPAVRVSTIAKLLGNYKELRDKYHLLEFFDHGEEGLRTAVQILKQGLKPSWRQKREKLLRDKIDVTRFMVDTVSDFCCN